jgi:hypothetical protein
MEVVSGSLEMEEDPQYKVAWLKNGVYLALGLRVV